MVGRRPPVTVRRLATAQAGVALPWVPSCWRQGRDDTGTWGRPNHVRNSTDPTSLTATDPPHGLRAMTRASVPNRSARAKPPAAVGCAEPRRIRPGDQAECGRASTAERVVSRSWMERRVEL